MRFLKVWINEDNNNNKQMLNVWINNNGNNEILKVGLIIITVMRFFESWVSNNNNRILKVELIIMMIKGFWKV